MFRIFFYILVIAGFSYGLSLIADMDGKLIIQWPGGEIQPSLMQAVLVFVALLILVLFIWTLFRIVMSSPEAFTRYLSGKKKKKGIDALSSGLIALGSGDDIMAQRYAMQAKKTLPNDPMTLMLRAQAAELKGDIQQASKLYESMLAASDTELFGLRGLYLLALQQNEIEAAAQYAARAVQRRPDLSWAVLGLFDLQCKKRMWRVALDTLKIANEKGHIQAKVAKRKRAVLLTALAIEIEDSEMEQGLKFAVEANRLAPSLIPAAVVAGRIYASKGLMGPAIKVIRKCWKIAPHPDLAIVSAFARPGDSVRDRLERIKSLAKLTPGHKEAALAVGLAAIEAQDWASAREALGPLTRGRPTQRVCTLMARIEAADSGDTGLVREWLARGIHAVQDPQWVADGVVADEWSPISPISSKLDAFEWKVPPEVDVLSEETHTLKKLLAGLVTADGLSEKKTIGNSSALMDEGASHNKEDISIESQNSSTVSDLEWDEDDDDETILSDDTVIVDEVDKVIEEPDVADGSAVSKVDVEFVNVIDEEIPVIDKTDEQSGKVDAKQSEDKIETKVKGKPKSKRRRRKRTKMYVAPHAPDDPGTDEADELDLVDSVRPIRF